MNHLIEKYNVAAPRYTSYPTVPFWDVAPTGNQWKTLVKEQFDVSNENEGISVYIHLPFCESLCTYCGCNTRITVNHKVETVYIQALLKEWKLYMDLFGRKPKIKELHLGGGTPTFFNPIRLKHLIENLFSEVFLCDNVELSFEAHPNNTSDEHLKGLYQLGFRRLSLGIQDFDPDVQTIINRIQSYESVKYVTQKARESGYTSVNYDLIYGLPLQTQRSMKKTIEKVLQLRPDRIAFYSYAHVPWLKPGQRKFTEIDLPAGETKRALYEQGRVLFEEAGYKELGMDHFVLETDSLYHASGQNKLNRNFMGYTSTDTKLLIGLGVSAISDAWNGFIQNQKTVEAYYKDLENGIFPFFKGHVQSTDDIIIRKHILNIMCRMETSWNEKTDQCNGIYDALERLHEMEKDNLVIIQNNHLQVSALGKPFVRNICMAFDNRLWESKPQTLFFSTSI